MTGFSIPDDVAVVSVRVPALPSLYNEDRGRAVALALTRDLGIRAETVEFAFEPLGALSPDKVMVAYRSRSSRATSPDAKTVYTVDLSWANKVADGTVFWIVGDAVAGSRFAHAGSWLLSDQGAVSLPPLAATNTEPPSALFSLAGSRARANQALRIVVVEPKLNTNVLLDEVSFAHWSASLGATFERGELAFSGARWMLSAPPAAQTLRRATHFDRALNYTLAASVVCALFSLARYALTPTADAIATRVNPPAGELLLRTTTAAPDLNEHLREATFAGGAWVIAAPSLPTAKLPRVEAMLAANAIATRTVREPELRIRVQSP
jgi:hypothetical protein